MRSLLRKANPITVTAAVALLLLVVLAVIGPILFSAEAERTDAVNASAGFSGEHWFGTDQLGRDLFARTLVATRLSLLLAVTAAVIGMVIGIPLGILPAVLGGRVRRLVAGFIAASVALPGLLLALFVNTIIGVGATGAVLGIGIANAPTLARLAQTTSAGIAARDYVAAARMLGASRFTLLFRHILPNVAEPLILTGTMSVGWCLLEISALSFLGLGVRAPSYDWGDLLNQGLQGIYVNPMGALGPGLFVVLGGLGFALLGESVTSLARRVPRLRGAAAEPVAHAGREPGDEAVAVAGLRVQYPSRDGTPLDAVDDVSFALRPGERVGIVGESGSGKSTTVLGIAELIAYPGRVTWQQLRINGVDLVAAAPQQRRRLLGASVAMVSQDPMTALNPALRVGRQLAEVAQVHLGKGRSAANDLAVRQLEHVQITDPVRRARQFPHEFSGGMRQRAVIAMGLMGEPRLILADEPTTALDVTVQQQVLDLLERLNAETGAALLLVSHDIAVVTNRCSRVLVMYGGRVVEDASSDELLAGPAHPYARALLAAVPTMTSDRDRALATIPGRPPSLAEMPPGCSFAPRCPFADDRCRAEQPPLIELSATRRVECWKPVGVAREHA
ncbi:dipeptide/oligopeptide/nickel ABC transporter permease/ATP-binding protein [Dactylosporangium sp. CA-092794]|uniref:dipeptide/oligopeptide/nickel ABC transporter permease/ATP-binding protein n=1 Tax=Dactylosporangium sp. CA-092794 TaxID=3239929 RepID=UPI003D91C934